MAKLKLKKAEKSRITSISKISPELSDVDLVSMRVEDPEGKRSATVFCERREVSAMPEGDWGNIRIAITSSRFVEGATCQLPWEPPPELPCFPFPRRSLLVLPGGVRDFREAPYAYYGKGLRFDPTDETELDPVELRRVLFGEKIPSDSHAVYPAWDAEGRLSLHPYPAFKMGRLPFEHAEHEYAMMYLAREKRGLADFIDAPKMYGIFDKTFKGVAPQGFVMSRLDDFDQRGDMEMTSINQRYLGMLLTQSPEKKKAILEKVMADVRARGGKPESFAPFADETDARKLSYLAFQIDALKDLGITDIRFAPLLHGADAQTLFMWRSDLETISAGAGRGASILVENGIVQMQPHLANFRFKRVAHRQRDLIPCDFENIRNLLVMTYPQAVGYIAGSLGNLINSSTNIERQGILTTLSPNILEAELRGFFIRFRGDGRLADTIALGRKTIAGGDGIDRNAVDYLLAESMETPITELRHPFISLLMDAYPEARHNEMQQRIHAR